MQKPRLLDLFCGEGGASSGYSRAGFDVVGVDIKFRRRYQFAFLEGDALEVLGQLRPGVFDAVHASPPCQAWSVSTAAHARARYPKLIEPVRRRLLELGVPYVIENVPGSPLIDPVALDGFMFGLKVIRRRHFETSFFAMTPRGVVRPKGLRRGIDFFDVTGAASGAGSCRGGRGRRGTTDEWRLAMDMPWASKAGMAQAIPPAYTEFLGQQLLQILGRSSSRAAA